MVELYILLVMSCTGIECSYDTTQYDNLTIAQCQRLLPVVQETLPSDKKAVCIPIDFE